MNGTKSVEIAISPLGNKTTILVDGIDVTRLVSGFDLRSHVGEISTLTLKLPLRAPGQIAGDARVVVDGLTVSLLRALGWTPPDVAP
jgi:hypothetical protein